MIGIENSQLQMLHSPSGLSRPDEELTPKQRQLKDACQEFEAVLAATILKEGLNSAMEMSKGSDDEVDNGSQTYMQMANEQMAYYVGKKGLLGLGDQIYDQVKDRLQES